MTPRRAVTTQPRFTLGEFERMVDAAVFCPDRRIELLFGELHELSPIGPCHRRAVVFLTEWARDSMAGLRDRLPLLSPDCGLKVGLLFA